MRKFGLIGFPLTHSFSRKYFTDLFEKEGIDAVYENYPLTQIDEIWQLFEDPKLEGINVTIPYKEAVLPFLDALSPAVQEIGACNCIHLHNGTITGHNTDVIGFERSLETRLDPQIHNRALVLGTGGAAKAVVYVMKKKGIPFIQVSRQSGEGKISYKELTPAIVSAHPLIINTTPLGMYPNVDACPELPYDALTSQHYLYDLVYNPELTLFLKYGQQRGAVIENGKDMLVIQANESRKIWAV